MKTIQQLRIAAAAFIMIIISHSLSAQIIPVGNGSYTTTFPGVDAAGRNGYPSGIPQLSGNALGKPVPTNDWWSTLIKEDHAGNLFSYPLAMKTKNSGLMLSYIPWGVLDDQEPIIIGVEDLNVSRTTVSDYSDWTVTMDWGGEFQATSGIGMPFVYFEKGPGKVAKVHINKGTVSVADEMLLVIDAHNGADFAIYAPVGSTWVQDGASYTSTLNAKNYWSVAILPQDASDPSSIAEEYKKYAYVFPENTSVNWSYDEANAVLRTDFTVAADIKEGSGSTMLLGLLPHQWGNLSSDSPTPQEYSYTSVRGELKTLDGNSFSVENSFFGIVPTLPYLSNYSEGFNPVDLKEKVNLLENEGLATWTDSYNEGQAMNRLMQTAHIADKMGELEARDKIVATIKERLEDWLTAEASEIAFLFYYNSDWTALLGYPAGHGQDNNINDHHFHWGYFIHAAAFMEQYEPGWAAEWGEMIDLIVRDAATPDRNDPLFPFLRNFSPYAGHCWANGFATFPQGNDQESTSESMQFNSSLIHWGSITGDDEIRDLGIYLYTTEQSAVEEYWFDMHDRVFKENQQYSLVSRVWGNSYDNGTFWTSDIAASYGIELYPIHGGSMYLGQNIDYASSLWSEIESNTGILGNDDNINLWHDVMWKYLSFTDPQKAIGLYNNYQERNIKFGVSDAHTYYWLHTMNALGQVDTSIAADDPLALVFNNNDELTYVAHNYSATENTVTFTDGYELSIPAYSMRTSRDINISGTISSSFSTAYPGGSVMLTFQAENGVPDKVEFYRDTVLIGEASSEPYEINAEDLYAGIHNFYAKIYQGESFNVSNILRVLAGSQQAYSGSASVIPGTIEAGHYDAFPGGKGQGIVYLDNSPGNSDDFRPDEDVDAGNSSSEGAFISNISDGEWLEYTVNVTQSGFYDFVFRYACGNESGGGPFHLELDGDTISGDIHTNYTGDWDNWQSKTVSDLALPQGLHVLRLRFDRGEFNLAKMTFNYVSDLPYGHPVADAGANVSVTLPATTANLNGSQSSDPDGDDLSFSWIQVDGPSLIQFSDNAVASPSISNLLEGVYTCQLTVSDGEHTSSDIVYIAVSETGNLNPTISIVSPGNNESFEEGSSIDIQVHTNDFEGEVSLVEFFDGETKIGEDESFPFSMIYTNPGIGVHELSARATDADGASGTSESIFVSVVEVQECMVFSNEAQEGNFSIGYLATFRTVGTDLTITFELLDKDKSGVVASLWQQDPFMEVDMDHISGNSFSVVLKGLTPGTTEGYACKFAFAGGMAVTQFISYELGTECEGPDLDIESPKSFTASLGDVTSSSVSLNLRASDNSGSVVYEIEYGSESEEIAGTSGNQLTYVVEGLEPSTSYEFTISALDSSGNEAANSPIRLNATTEDDNTGVESEMNPLERIILYPNPVEELLTLRFEGDNYPKSFTVLNLAGMKQEIRVNREQELRTIDFSHFPAGVYVILFEYFDRSVYHKVVKK